MWVISLPCTIFNEKESIKLDSNKSYKFLKFVLYTTMCTLSVGFPDIETHESGK